MPFAFKDLMVHLILQFTLRIAIRCVLHRRENQEIHRTEVNGIGSVSRPLGALTVVSEVCSGLRKIPRAEWTRGPRHHRR